MNKGNIKLMIFFLIFVILVSVFLVIVNNMNERTTQHIAIKEKFCELKESKYIYFNDQDYCYVGLPNGIVMIELIETCYGQEKPCTFQLNQGGQ